VGDLFINDSSPGFPGVVMARATAIPKRYLLNFPAGEGLTILRTGVMAAIDSATVLGPVIYNPSFGVRATPTMPASGYTTGISSNHVDTFLALKTGGGATHACVVPFDADGVVVNPVWFPPTL
jgi:hypothetical protein